MRAGRLRDRVMIQSKVAGREPSGQPVEIWQDQFSRWAEVKHIGGRELMQSGSELAEVTVRIWMRDRADQPFTTADRILHPPPTGGGEVFDIRSIIPSSPGWLELLCVSGVKK